MAEVSDQIGSRKVFENDKIIMWYFELEPGEETPMHKHERPYMWYALQGAPLDCEDNDGNALGIFEVPSGEVFDIGHDGKQLIVNSGNGYDGATFPMVHKAKNAGSEKYVEILVEFKQ